MARVLIAEPPRETSGPETAKRYHYQALWGLTLLIDVHETLPDYAVVFELHDDVALLDSTTAPTRVSFYQVKTKETGHWTITDLLARKKAAKKAGTQTKLPSILGKMYDNVVRFGDQVDTTAFVSNADVSFAPASVDRRKFCLEVCDAEHIKKVLDQLKDEHPTAAAIKGGVIHFVKTDLSLGSPDDHAKGMFHTFVVKNLGQEAFALDTLYKAVVQDCERKAQVKDQFASLEETLRRKAITRATAEGWLAAVQESVECPDWVSVSPHLSLSVTEMGRMEREWNVYKIQRLGTNEAVRAVQDRIRRHLRDADCLGLAHMPLLEAMLPKVETYARDRQPNITTARVKVMILYEALTDAEVGELQGPDPQPADEEL